MTQRANQFSNCVRASSGVPIRFEMIPPLASTGDEKLQGWVDRLVSGLSDLPIAAVNIPEVRDEQHREGERTYRYKGKMEPRVCGRQLQEAFPGGIDTVINRVVVHEPVDEQRTWLLEGHRDWGVRNLVLVGGESPEIRYPGPSVTEAATLITEELNSTLPEAEQFLCGGIVIPTRRKEDSGFDEYSRMIYKQKNGIGFFSTQVLYEADSMIQLLHEYQEACDQEGLRPNRLFVSLAPLRLPKHIEFVKWLGVQVPDKVSEELLADPEQIGEQSIAVCCRVFETILEQTVQGKITVPLGLNIGPLVSGNFSLSLQLVERLGGLL